MWYGPHASPDARGHVKLEGAFLEGDFDGTVTTEYPSGAQRCLRVYDHGVLKSSQYWASDGTEKSPASADEEAARELNADLTYVASMENMVARALAQANRKILK
jgi:hypothetical protein